MEIDEIDMRDMMCRWLDIATQEMRNVQDIMHNAGRTNSLIAFHTDDNIIRIERKIDDLLTQIRYLYSERFQCPVTRPSPSFP